MSQVTWCVPVSAAGVTGTINWESPTGKTATARHYGLNAFHGCNPNVAGTPGSATYKANVAYMRPGMIRYHHADQILASSNARGWVLSPDTATCAWDTNKINNALSGAFSFGPTIMMTIVCWPAHMNISASDRRLAPAHYTNFAGFCASLVQIVNIQQGRNVPYWEVSNELEAVGYLNSMDEAARIYSLAATAMKAVDPTIKVGGAAFGSPENADHLNKYLSTVRSLDAPLDFVSYH